MSFVEQWNAIAARIRSLREGADLYAQFLISHREDTFGVGRELVGESRSILAVLMNFRQSLNATLPPDAKACLERFLDGRPAQIITSDDWTIANEVKPGPVLSFLLADTQEIIRARSERAFLHLQRLLAVDTDVQSKWKAAFEKGELSCEKLGGVHLLWHGIFAFKLQAGLDITDLVFQEPIDPSIVQRGIEGLVLTEWKVADETNALSRFEQARNQAARYQQGALAGTELAGYRYAVAVSLTELPKALVPEDRAIGRVIYRHINIGIEPRRTSVQARADSRRR